MSGIQKELGPKGFAVVEGVVNEDGNIPEFIQKFNPSFPVGKANTLGVLEYMQMNPSVRAFVPYMVFIDRQGIIRAQYTGSDKIMDESVSDKLLREEAEKYLNESPAKPKAKSKGL